MTKEKAKQELCSLLGVTSLENIPMKRFAVLLNRLSGTDYDKAKMLIIEIWFEV